MLLNRIGKEIMEKYINSKILMKTVLRMAKSYSSFFYFTMEANDNISFYSTLPFEKGQNYRDIVVYSTPELFPHFESILKHCQKSQEIEILEQCSVQDN